MMFRRSRRNKWDEDEKNEYDEKIMIDEIDKNWELKKKNLKLERINWRLSLLKKRWINI